MSGGQAIDDDDELPPWLGERFRDVFDDIFRAAQAPDDQDMDHE